jgi:membrane-associated phospholipid phosphatase
MPVETAVGPLSLPGNIRYTNTLSNANTSDTFSFSLSSTQNVSLNANANMRLSRASSINGSLEVSEDIIRSTGSISQALTPGNYIVTVDRGQSTASIAYGIDFSVSNPNNIYDVNTLNGAKTFSGTVGTGNTTDLYRFSLNSASELSVKLRGMTNDADIRLGVDRNRNGVFDAGEEVARSNRYLNFDELIRQSSLAAGNYLVAVDQYNGDTHYRLALEATPNAVPGNPSAGGASADLTGDIRNVVAPDIRVANQAGQAQVEVRNQGAGFASGPVQVQLYASTNLDYDGNDELLGTTTVNLSLNQGQSQFVDFRFGAPTGVAPGSYYLLARIDSNNAIAETNEKFNNLTSYHVSAPGTDVILDWNATLLNIIQAVDTPPPAAARNQAILHTAMFDAVNAIERRYGNFIVPVAADFAANASAVAAATQAAYQVLLDLYPTQRFELELQRDRSLSEVPDGVQEDRGVAVGQFVADRVLANRLTDGTSGAQDRYTPGTRPGAYQYTQANSFAALPGFGQVRPFAIGDVSRFVPSGPPVYGGSQYAAELNEVQRLGGVNSTVRTGDQSEIAVFWAYDRGDTFRPPAQWNQIAETVALREGRSLLENARLFAHLNIAEADAGIVAWQAKYQYNQLRPITAVRLADNDGNPLTTGNANWQSFLPTPPFPDYISGHSTFGAAAATVLTSYFGSNYAFSVTSQEMPGTYRSFRSFAEAAIENGESRVYGGVHVQTSNVDGLLTGERVANYVLQNTLA